mmetsp:Transcript_51696/g.129727  ORF Transcript_51696/g.129727 Transcript_51696/m.129727 type:complete len:782 (-) Transcript_51696:90-2435(-)
MSSKSDGGGFFNFDADAQWMGSLEDDGTLGDGIDDQFGALDCDGMDDLTAEEKAALMGQNFADEESGGLKLPAFFDPVDGDSATFGSLEGGLEDALAPGGLEDLDALESLAHREDDSVGSFLVEDMSKFVLDDSPSPAAAAAATKQSAPRTPSSAFTHTPYTASPASLLIPGSSFLSPSPSKGPAGVWGSPSTPSIWSSPAAAGGLSSPVAAVPLQSGLTNPLSMTPVTKSHAHLTAPEELLSPDRLGAVRPAHGGPSALGALFQDAPEKPSERLQPAPTELVETKSQSTIEMSDEQRAAMEKELRQYQNQFFRIPSFRRDQQRMNSAEINQVVRMQRFMLLNSGDPFMEDYYYQTLLKRKAIEDSQQTGDDLSEYPLPCREPMIDTRLPPVRPRKGPDPHAGALGNVPRTRGGPVSWMEQLRSLPPVQPGTFRHLESPVQRTAVPFKFPSRTTLETAFEHLLDAEDIADVMRVQDPDAETTAYLADRSKETIQKLYQALYVYTPRGDVVPFSAPNCKFCFPEDAPLLELLCLPKAHDFFARALRLFTPWQVYSIVVALIRNVRFFMNDVIGTASTDDSERFLKVLTSRIITLALKQINSSLQTFLFFISDNSFLQEIFFNQAGSQLLAALLNCAPILRTKEAHLVQQQPAAIASITPPTVWSEYTRLLGVLCARATPQLLAEWMTEALAKQQQEATAESDGGVALSSIAWLVTAFLANFPPQVQLSFLQPMGESMNAILQLGAQSVGTRALLEVVGPHLAQAAQSTPTAKITPSTPSSPN